MEKDINVGGTIHDSNTFFYIHREVEEKLKSHILCDNSSNVQLINGARQMGKTSLGFYTAKKLREEYGYCTIFLDMSAIYPASKNIMPNNYEFSYKFMNAICDEYLNPQGCERFKTWVENQERLQNGDFVVGTKIFIKFFKNFFLKEVAGKLLIILDEFFEGIRRWHPYWHNLFTFFDEQNKDPEIKQRVNFLLVSNLTLSEGYDDNGSKFNWIKQFNIEDFDYLNSRHVYEWAESLNKDNAESLAREALEETGGQPYLTAFILNEIKEENATVDNALKNLISSGDIHFEYPREILRKDKLVGPIAIKIARMLRNEKVSSAALVQTLEPSVKRLLIRSGLVKQVGTETDGASALFFKSPVYRKFFTNDWFDEVRQSMVSNGFSGDNDSFTKPKKHIAIINVGGTLGMVDSGDFMTGPMDMSEFLGSFAAQALQMLNIRLLPYDFPPCDGVNVGLEHWNAIADSIFSLRTQKDIAGVVILHGTDTIAYTASAVAFALGRRLPFPVVFTGSQAPSSVAHGDAATNFTRACIVASNSVHDNEKKLPNEVMIVFDSLVFRAVRVEKIDDFKFSGFSSPSFSPLATIGEKIILNYVPYRNDQTSDLTWTLRSGFEDRILRISHYPGLRGEYFEVILDQKEDSVKGILIESQGIYNLTNEPENSPYNMLPLIKKANDLDIPVVISSRYPIQPEFANKYKPAEQTIQSGAIVSGNMTAAAATTKFMWLLNQAEINNIKSKTDFIRENFSQSLVGEVDLPDTF